MEKRVRSSLCYAMSNHHFISFQNKQHNYLMSVSYTKGYIELSVCQIARASARFLLCMYLIFKSCRASKDYFFKSLSILGSTKLCL